MQIRTIGHTCTGSCICKKEKFLSAWRFVFNPQCPDDKTVKFNPQCPVRGHSDKVFSVAYSPDGKHIVSGSFDYTVKILDAQKGEEVRAPNP